MNSEFQYVQRDRRLEEVPLVDELLERQLVQPVREVRLEVHDRETVRERGLWGLAVDEAADDLVDDGKPQPDRQLAPQIRPTPRQISPPDCNDGGHARVILDKWAEASAPRTAFC